MLSRQNVVEDQTIKNIFCKEKQKLNAGNILMMKYCMAKAWFCCQMNCIFECYNHLYRQSPSRWITWQQHESNDELHQKYSLFACCFICMSIHSCELSAVVSRNCTCAIWKSICKSLNLCITYTCRTMLLNHFEYTTFTCCARISLKTWI